MDIAVTINNSIMAGVRPGKGFYDALQAPLETKDYITNESRLEDGVRVLFLKDAHGDILPPKFKKRSLTLEFNIVGDSAEAFQTNRDNFFSALYAGEVVLEVTGLSEVYHLIYTGKSQAYTGGRSGWACKVKVGFDEPNPANRT